MVFISIRLWQESFVFWNALSIGVQNYLLVEGAISCAENRQHVNVNTPGTSCLRKIIA